MAVGVAVGLGVDVGAGVGVSLLAQAFRPGRNCRLLLFLS